MLKVGEVIKIRDNYYKVAVGDTKPSCVRCWFLAGMRWCRLNNSSRDHLKNMDDCRKLIDINKGQYFTIVQSSDVKEGI